MTDNVQLPRRAKGERPYFFDDPAIDQLHAMFLALAAELSVAYDRIDTLERLLDQQGVLKRETVESYRPDDAVEAARATRRNEYLARLFRILRDQREALSAAGDMPQYTAVVDKIARD